MAVKIKKASKGMKIRGGGQSHRRRRRLRRDSRRSRADFSIMFDRTAHAVSAGQKSGTRNGPENARALESTTRTGWKSLTPGTTTRPAHPPPRRHPNHRWRRISRHRPFRQCCLNQTYDILQPGGRSGGIICRKWPFWPRCFTVHPPRTMGLMPAGWLQSLRHLLGCRRWR
jgi:hypothetical protein